MNQALVTRRLMMLALVCVVGTAATGCGLSLDMEPPANGVQVRVEKKISSELLDEYKEKLKELIDEGNASTSHISMNGKATLNFSPVSDPQAFADKIDFAKVVKVEGKKIWLEELDETEEEIPEEDTPADATDEPAETTE